MKTTNDLPSPRELHKRALEMLIQLDGLPVGVAVGLLEQVKTMLDRSTVFAVQSDGYRHEIDLFHATWKNGDGTE